VVTRSAWFLTALATPLCLAASAVAAPIAELSFHAGSDSTIDEVYQASAGDSLSADIRARLPDGEPAELSFSLVPLDFSNAEFAILSFGTDALNLPMAPGYYPNAERADFASPGHPGLDFAFAGAGYNTLTGSFTVSKVAFSSDLQTVLSFAATFQIDGGQTGRFEYEASGVLPEPGAALLGLLALVPLAVRSFRRNP
jgi:hypothetical protein